MKFVNIYIAYRRYGGPEEGGWYYDEGTPQHSRGPYPDEMAEQMLKVAQKDMEEANKSRPPIYSSRSTGVFVALLEEHRAERWPAFPPYYR